MTPLEIKAFNGGVMAVLAIAEKAALAITTTGTRPIAENFAIAALAELAEAGRQLLIRPDNAAAPAKPATNPRPTSPESTSAATASILTHSNL